MLGVTFQLDHRWVKLDLKLPELAAARNLLQMTKKLPLSNFRALRSKLEPHEFAISEGQDVSPTDLIKPDIWNGIMHLPEEVSSKISGHNGTRLELLYCLWSGWIVTTGDPERPDEIINCMLDAADCFQCATFNFIHCFYRGALAELRTALELVTIGAYGNLCPVDPDYLTWKAGTSERNFPRCRRRLKSSLRSNQCRWFFDHNPLLAALHQKLCNYAHFRPDSSDAALWQSNGPIYNNDAIPLTFPSTLTVQAACYLLTRLAIPSISTPTDRYIPL